MWLENLKELKKSSGMTSKQISDVTKIPESTIKRIFAGTTNDPSVSTIHRIVIALGGSLDNILADTDAILAPETIVEVKETLEEVKETANVMEAERNLIKVENERLKIENANMATELQLLKMELQHKDELLELHKFYRKLIPNN